MLGRHLKLLAVVALDEVLILSLCLSLRLGLGLGLGLSLCLCLVMLLHGHLLGHYLGGVRVLSLRN